MNRIEPRDFYLDMPCSIVAIGCALDDLNRLQFTSLLGLYNEAKANNNYAPLQRVGQEIYRHLQVKKYTYFPRAQRIALKDFRGSGKAIICVYGHYLYCDFTIDSYYSFFDNDEDKVVAVWELK